MGVPAGVRWKTDGFVILGWRMRPTQTPCWMLALVSAWTRVVVFQPRIFVMLRQRLAGCCHASWRCGADVRKSATRKASLC